MTNPLTSRRNFLAVMGGGALASSALYADHDDSESANPNDSDIEHIIVLMMENRSFDHFLGWLPNADGKPAGLLYPDRNGMMQQTYHLIDYQGCGHPVPDNSYTSARVEYDNGLCDGWLKAGTNDNYTIGYYEAADLAFLGQASRQWMTFDRYFSATLSSTFPNRMYQHAAQTDRQDNSLSLSTLPTIWDALAAHHRTGRYYFSDVPFLALWGPKYLPISHPIDDFFADCATGSLPDVAFVEPHMLGETEGLSNDDHPHADIRNGEALMNQVYSAVTRSPAWKKTVLVINFDEWGGFFDHVPPQTAPDVNAANSLRGFRVPCLVISPWSFGSNAVNHQVYDHTSILKMIEWRWGLPPLTVRDSAANNLALALNSGKPLKNAPVYSVPSGGFGQFCLSGLVTDSEWAGLAALARLSGWPIR